MEEGNQQTIYKEVLINCEGLIGLSPASKGSFIILNIILKQRFISCNLYFFKNSENSFNFENPFYKQQELGNLKSF